MYAASVLGFILVWYTGISIEWVDAGLILVKWSRYSFKIVSVLFQYFSIQYFSIQYSVFGNGTGIGIRYCFSNGSAIRDLVILVLPGTGLVS